MEIVTMSPDALERALDILRDGGVVAHATETCYGLACDLQRPDAVAKLFAIKHRPENQPVSALFASVEESKQFLQWNDIALNLATEHLPGPLAMVLTALPGCPLYTTPGGGGNIGVRVSSHPTAMQLVEKFGSPLSTTSANLHGKPSPYSAQAIADQYANSSPKPDIILDDGPLPEAPPSTVIDVSDGTVHVLRQGEMQV